MWRLYKIHILITLLFLVAPAGCLLAAQVTTSGNWDDSGIWAGGNIGDNITEDVTFNNNIGTVVVRNTFSFTIGNLDLQQGNTLTIEAGGSLDVGDVANPKNFTSGNTTTLNIDGDLIIWGNLNMGNTLTINVTGSLIIKGSVIGGNNATLEVNGSMTIEGDLTVGNGSSVSGSGTIDVGGTCSDGNSNFCGQGPLPVELIGFYAKLEGNHAKIYWSTASELNNDFFTLEKSKNGLDFELLDYVQGNGTKSNTSNYDFIDKNPYLGLSYYRLSQTDYDGTTEIFPAITLMHIPQEFKFSVNPNPIQEQIVRIRAFGKDKNEQLELRIFDINGNAIEVALLNADELGILDVEYEIQHSLSAGTFIFELSSSLGKETVKVFHP